MEEETASPAKKPARLEESDLSKETTPATAEETPAVAEDDGKRGTKRKVSELKEEGKSDEVVKEGEVKKVKESEAEDMETETKEEEAKEVKDKQNVVEQRAQDAKDAQEIETSNKGMLFWSIWLLIKIQIIFSVLCYIKKY